MRSPYSAAARRRAIRRRRAIAVTAMLVLVAAAAGGIVALSAGSPAKHDARGRLALPTTAPRNPRPGNVNIYAHTMAGMLTPITRRARYLVYAPDSEGDGVYVINPKTYKVIDYLPTGAVVQHVVPAWDLRTLYATNDVGNSLTPINPDTGRRAGPNIPVADPYNMYFTPDGRHAIVVQEALDTLSFRDPHTFALQRDVHVDCRGVDHLDFSADGSFALASCEFAGEMVEVDLRTETVTQYVHVGGSPQDVKLSPDGNIFYVANRTLGGVQLIDARTMRLIGFIRTGLDAHGLYVSRNTKDLYVTDRAGEAITVIDFATRKVIATWKVPGTPDMGNVSPDGSLLWVGGRYSSAVFAISTRTGHVVATIHAGISPHGVCVWPQPGRYSTGHTGVMR
jgi:YVTN family beta-propeller protein